MDGDRGEVVGDHVVQLAGHPGALGGHRLAAVHLGEQRGLLGAQPGGLGGVAVVADDRRRSRPGRSVTSADDHADQQACGVRAPGARQPMVAGDRDQRR